VDGLGTQLPPSDHGGFEGRYADLFDHAFAVCYDVSYRGVTADPPGSGPLVVSAERAVPHAAIGVADQRDDREMHAVRMGCVAGQSAAFSDAGIPTPPSRAEDTNKLATLLVERLVPVLPPGVETAALGRTVRVSRELVDLGGGDPFTLEALEDVLIAAAGVATHITTVPHACDCQLDESSNTIRIWFGPAPFDTPMRGLNGVVPELAPIPFNELSG
jgi:hypothetical protein